MFHGHQDMRVGFCILVLEGRRWEGHQKGVLSLTYNDDFKLLLSADLSMMPLCGAPFSPTAIFKLRGTKTPDWY